MLKIKPLIGLALSLTISVAPALAYGIAISSTTGANIDAAFKQYENAVLDKLAACTKDAGLPATSSCDVIIDQNGKVADAYFRPVVPTEPAANETLQKIKDLDFGAVPGIQQGDVTITFNFAELQSPPYRMNSLRIGSKGSITAGGDIDVSGKPRVAIRPPGGRVYGNRISGPIELGPPRGAAEAARARNLKLQLHQAIAAKKFDEAVSLQKQIVELTKSSAPQDKGRMVREYIKLVTIAVDSGQNSAVAEAFAQLLSIIDEAGDGGVQYVSRLAALTHRLVGKDMIDTADSGIRKAVELDAVLLKSGAAEGRTSLSYPVKMVADAHRKKGDFDAAVALQRFRLEKYLAAEPDNTAAISVCQLDLSSALVDAALHNPDKKKALLDESGDLFEKVENNTRKAFGADSQELKNAVNRRIIDLNRIGDSAAAEKLRQSITP